ncbi:ThiF family adenylyltransferase [candidate division TA06 bacterium]|uniref:ThiF family adenylyltransferase n=1 Tax=candidate division TA06 bacterium TaxID=2250710 RepID=A0A933ML21_UNCT6|nr:ThiF family adenylyltransferase [candidate division TA06 bacterium]
MNGRYSRQEMLPEIGQEGQKRLAFSRAAVIGCGALGTVMANLLARMGVGYIKLIDRDVVELSNLQRQVLYDESDIGRYKAEVAAEKLRKINREIEIVSTLADIRGSTMEQAVKDCSIILDGTDNFNTRLAINDACVKHGIPWVYCGVVGTTGVSLPVIPQGPCLRCLLPAQTQPQVMETCDLVGVFGPAVSIIASIAVAQAAKILLGNELKTELIQYDCWSGRYSQIEIPRNESCPCCVQKCFDYLSPLAEDIVTKLCGRNMILIQPARQVDFDLPTLAQTLAAVGTVHSDKEMLVFRVGDMEMSLFKGGGAMIRGTEDKAIARSFYSRYLGL